MSVTIIRKVWVPRAVSAACGCTAKFKFFSKLVEKIASGARIKNLAAYELGRNLFDKIFRPFCESFVLGFDGTAVHVYTSLKTFAG